MQNFNAHLKEAWSHSMYLHNSLKSVPYWNQVTVQIKKYLN